MAEGEEEPNRAGSLSVLRQLADHVVDGRDVVGITKVLAFTREAWSSNTVNNTSMPLCHTPGHAGSVEKNPAGQRAAGTNQARRRWLDIAKLG